jgi:5-hydroxyisourate hydrolase-like protein (transthyretin family)
MIDAALEEYGKISGTVHAPDGSPAAGIWVIAYRQYEKWWEPISGAETREDGTYVLGGLTTGTYRVEFFDPSGEYAWEYYDNKVMVERATNIAVTTGTITPGIDATLGVAGKISGTVTSATDGTPIEGAWVNVYRNNAGSWDWTWAGAETGPDGSYTIGGLPSGVYRLEYWDWSGAYAGEFYDGKDTLRSATAVAVRAGSTRAGIDVTLDPVGGISGTVTSAADGTTVQGAWVSAYRTVGKSWEWYGDAETGDDGTYSISGLPAGNYRLEIYDPSGEYAYEFYDGKDTLERANSVTVATGLVTPDIDVTLDPASRITGRLTSATDDEPIGTGVAIAYRQNGRSFEPIGYGETMPDGTYTIGGLRAGTYRVEFFDWEGDYAYEFYDDAATLASAKDIVIGTGSETVGIDAMLDPAGKISGKVTLAADGSPLEYAWVTVYRQVGKGGWEPMFGAETAADGSYTVGGLRTGTYRAQFMYWGEAFGAEFYDDATTLRKATDIGVTAGETTPDINAALELGAWPGKFTSLGTSRGAPRSGPKYSTIDVRERLMR